MMKIEFKSTIPVIAEEDIYIGDKRIGKMKQHEDFGGIAFHVSIDLPGYISLIQGFGATREEAIQHALNKGREDANQLLNEIAALRKMLD